MQARRRKPERGDPLLERRRRVKAVLDALGVRAAFDAMPASIRERFVDVRCPDPKLTFAPSFPSDDAVPGLRATLSDAFRRATVDDPLGRSMAVRDFWTILPTIAATVRGARNNAALPATCRRFMNAAASSLEYWMGQIDAAWDALHAAVICPLVERSRLDGRMFSASVVQETAASGDRFFRMRLSCQSPQPVRATIDGESRPVWRVGTSNAWHDVKWLSWSPAILGRTGDAELPIYAQSHALRQLRSRVDLPAWSGYLETWLHASLAEPAIVERQSNGDLLVEYRVHDARLGYLVVTPLADRVVVRTFLFLTMTPSPEARQLARQLRLGRDDVNWLGLHELSAFTRTDLRDDATLRRLLASCGCGHLFDLDDDADVAPSPRALATEMKRYLQLAA